MNVDIALKTREVSQEKNGIKVLKFSRYEDLEESSYLEQMISFFKDHPRQSFFQHPCFFKFIESIPGYHPILWLAVSEEDKITGSLLGVMQWNGNHIKATLSKRMICWGGPLAQYDDPVIITSLLEQLKKDKANGAIYAEFRNFHDLSSLKKDFIKNGYRYKPHLNFIVKTDELTAVKKRMSKSRLRQIKSTLKLGATIEEPQHETEVKAFYQILEDLYREKVKKPLPDYQLFQQFWLSDIAKIFLVKFEGEVVGGILCPILKNKIIYEWYVCGKDGLIKGLYPSVLATWAPIQYGIDHGFDHFDFMGAGKPDEDYGVREFKARFGGEQVCHGRFEQILNPTLYKIGKFGLNIYQKLR